MGSWRRIFGVDVVESVIWVTATFLVAIMGVEYSHDRMAGFGFTLAGLIGYGVRRHLILRAFPPDGESSGAWRAAELEARVAELEQLSARLAELEERVDFSERLLASKDEPARAEGQR
jgi:hypothetical protein